MDEEAQRNILEDTSEEELSFLKVIFRLIKVKMIMYQIRKAEYFCI